MLRQSIPSKHNAMLGKLIPHSESTKYEDDEGENFGTPPAKRIKHTHSPAKRFHGRTEIADSDADSDGESLEQPPRDRRTDLETALPPIQTNREAIEAKEAT